MNLPNVTLIFQMANFLVAYCILRVFVFAPALKIICMQETKVQDLQDKINFAREKEQEILQKQLSRWNFIKKSLRAIIPNVASKNCQKIQDSEAKEKFQKIELTDIQKSELKNMLHDELMDIK